MLDFNSIKPIFIQIAEWTEDEILAGRIKEGDKLFSQIEYANFFGINPLTAGKGVTLLEQKGIVEKRRGVGMFVVHGAKDKILDYRKNESLIEIIDDMLKESKKLGITLDDVIEMVRKRSRIDD